MGAKLRKIGNHTRLRIIGLVVTFFTVVGFGITWSRFTAPKIPTAEVKHDLFVDNLQLRGEIKAVKSVVLSAPSTAGDIQILVIVQNGSTVKKGDVVVQFDTTNLERTAEQKKSELKEAEAGIEQVQAQAKLQEEQALTELLKAQYDVERAKLEVSKREILSKIDFEKAKLGLVNAEQKLHESEEKLKTDRLGAAADVESKRQKREKALFDVRQTERSIAAMTLRAPIDGMVTLLPNWRAGGFFTDTAPEFKQGDRAWAGAAIVELPDLSAVRMSARIDETDRGRLKSGQKATVRVDALPDRELHAVVREISPLTKPDFSGWPPTKNFDLMLQLEQTDTRLRPGMSATARVAVEQLPDSLVIPTEASFQKSGRTVAYVLRRSKFEERAIEVARRGNGKLVVSSGLKAGEKIALKDPTVEGSDLK